MVSAFAVRQRLVLGQVKVGEKANEIGAIPKLLEMLEIEGAIVTIDAMGCQRAIAQQIIDQKADYVLALKGNQTSLHDDVRLLATEQKARHFADTRTERETRFYLSSLNLPADKPGPIVRSHRAMENSLHWVMDMVFRDDECRVRSENAPANFTTIKHIATRLLRLPASKDSLRSRRKIAAWDDDFPASLIAA